MLVKGKIPTAEPIVSIGLILPEDEQTSVIIKDDEALETNLMLNIQTENKHLLINKIPKNKFLITKSPLTLNPIRAGRGFHWEKQISIRVDGTIEVKNQNGFLFVINHIPLEKYLASVAVSEMSSKCPDTFLQAQTITARSWILATAENKHSDLGIDACNDDCCQRYQGTAQITSESKSACNATSGTVLLFENEICDARYSKSCGGLTENAEIVWEMNPQPYLTSVYDGPENTEQVDWQNWFKKAPKTFCGPSFIDESELHQFLGNVDKDGKYFRWSVEYSQKEFCAFFSKNINRDIDCIIKINVLNRGHSGRINNLYINYQTEEGKSKILQLKSEFEIRRLLHPSFLYSSCFMINMDENFIKLYGAGWGHGVGLCQIGALGMALNNYSTNEILTHYFIGTELKRLY